MTAWAPAGGADPGPDDEPYTGPPPTGRYAAPPLVPWAHHGPLSAPGAGPLSGPVPWPLGPVPMAHVPLAGTPVPPAPWNVPRTFVPPPGMRFEPPPGTPPHDVPQPFTQAMRTRDWRWWRPLLGLLLLTVVYSVASTVVVLLALLTGWAPDLALISLVDPGDLLVTNLTLIIAIPAVWLSWVAAHGLRPGWSASVTGRLRWRLFPRLVPLGLLALGVGIGLSVLFSLLLDGGGVTGPVRSFGWLLVVVFLTTPLQSAAEEYLFRGYLSQAIAGWIGREPAGAVVAALVTAALFSLAHVPPDLGTFLDRFAFGLAASAVTWLTGGLEAAIVLHAVNNVVVFVLAGSLGDGVATTEVPDGSGWLFLLLTVLAMGGYVLLVRRAVPRLRPETVTAAQDLRVPAALAEGGAQPPSGRRVQSSPAPRGAHSTNPWGMG
ncbi:CPBP family glutamic-type intramembrane protease [Blastococcus sp. SYSU D00820]